MSWSSTSPGRVLVFARTRPTPNFPHEMIHLEQDGKTVSIHLPKHTDKLQGYINNQQQDWSFPLDGVLHNASQEDVYTSCGRELVTRVMDGFNATVMAYGQTGAGKTHTMTGPGPSPNFALRGIIPRAIAQIFQEVRERQESAIIVRISYLEIYNEVIFDLLSTLPDATTPTATPTTVSSSGLCVSEDERGVVSVKGLSLRLATSEEDALNMLFEGEANRIIAEHSLNQHSSRSHCIFTVHIESRSRTLSTPNYTLSKLNLVDLAGSERLSKTNSTGSVQREALYINKSLSFLEQVIRALSDKKRDHVPYRQSKLTHVLKDSLGGNCSTLVIANIWAERGQIQETISTLRFATRMMNVANDPVQNIHKDSDQLVKQYEEEIRALKLELSMHDTLALRGSVSYDQLGEAEIEEVKKEVELFLDGAIPEIEVVSIRQVKQVMEQFKLIVQSLQQSSRQIGGDSLPETTPTTQAQESHKTSTGHPSPTAKGRGKSYQAKSTLPPPPVAQPPPSAESAVEPELVGDHDGTGLAVGIAPSSIKHQASPVAATKKTKGVFKRRESKVKSDAPLSEEGQGEKATGSLESTSGSEPCPSTPPPKDEAFEQFKRERGSEINKILLLNKETLHQKKREAIELSSSINDIKKKIDEVRDYLESCRSGRDQEGVALATDGGEVIIEETEYHAITHLKQLKTQYRSLHTNLQTVQAEVQYCKQYVDETRQRLLNEFHKWYHDSFIGELDIVSMAGSKKNSIEYEHEKFDRLQASLLNDDPATTAFYNAQLRTEKRSYEQPLKKKTGHTTSNVRNQPPGQMAVN